MTNKILLIDDSKTQLDVLKTRFVNSGFEVESANNALEGYEKIYSFVPDIILSDVIMPDLDGYQFCRLLKNSKKTKNIPIILLTVLDKSMDKFWARNAGAQGFISKTAEFEDIKQKTLEVIAANPLKDEDRENIKNSGSSHVSVKEQLNNILNSLLMQSTFLNEFRNLGEYYSREKVLVEKSFELFSDFIDYDYACMFFNIADNASINTLYLDFKDSSVSPFVLEKTKRDFLAQMPDLCFSSEKICEYEFIRENKDDENRIVSPNLIKTSFIVPFVFENKLLGGIGFYSKEEINYKDFRFYEEFEKELLALMKMRSLYSEIEFLSVTDGLTGLYNRRYFEYNLEREFLRAKRYKNDLSLAILDIDFFKSINDTYGHQYGDYVLKEVSILLKESCRKTDILCRYGGEELIMIMPETSIKKALIPAKRLREKIAKHDFIYNGIKTKLTASIGISTMKNEFKTQKEIFESADLALYNAKNTGKNKVVTHDEQFGNSK